MLQEDNIIRSLLLVLVLFGFPKSNAIPIKDVNSLCKETSEVDLCLKHIGSDKRTVAARDFFNVSYHATVIQIQSTNAITHINNIRGNYNDFLARIGSRYAKENTRLWQTVFTRLGKLARKKSKALTDRMEMSDRMKAGFEAVSECEDEWSKHGPKQESPLVFYYHNLIILCQITRVIL
ncbi:hypothetical protein CARUB_v10024837mg [Capsella rubella]|uniref:Pectinesterase inhibitor domain-containing protein n=1 Tax=Capsella rubella TaxID=81985 RepID=R0G0F5_9BRAS|nr:hypothetical protein CARUB_v10024837mg [Capsella rubella]